MKIDFYTKAVLTVIAVCLVVLTIKQLSFVPTAKAAATGMEMTMHDYPLKPNYDGSINVKVIDIQTGYNGVPVEIKKFPSGTLPVEVKNSRYNSVPVDVQK